MAESKQQSIRSEDREKEETVLETPSDGERMRAEEKEKEASVLETLNDGGRMKESQSSKTKFYEVPEHLKSSLGFDGVVIHVDPDGACFFGASAIHLHGDKSKRCELRRKCHDFLVENWDYYSPC